MRTTHPLYTLVLLVAAAAFAGPATPTHTHPAAAQTTTRAQPDDLPNIIIIFTDDQGYADVGVYGATGFATPNLDKLASQGVRFTDWYVAQPVCSASRAGLLTGCYPNRIGITGALGPRATHGINASETTLAEICKSKGYATAMFGKWHLGHRKPFLPVHHGFDEYLGTPYSNDMWPWHPAYANLPDAAAKRKEGYPDLPLIKNDEIAIAEIKGEHQAQFTTMFAEGAVDFINRSAGKPFFLYVAHPMPHVPLFVSDKYAGKSEQGLYGDVISEIDWSVGQIMDALDANNIADNTLIIFTSDNGPWLNYGNHAGSTGPLREGKGTTFDGGVRTPCIMRFPRQIKPGSVATQPAMTIDLLPTIANLIGADLPEHKIDGLDIWPIIVGEPGATNPHDAYFFYYKANDLEAMRMGKWKLHFPHQYRTIIGTTPGKDGTPGPYKYPKTTVELYNLETDIGEATNVADQYPEIVERMTQLADEMRADLGDNLTKTKASGKRPPGRVNVKK
jgi:arylsulfatase A